MGFCIDAERYGAMRLDPPTFVLLTLDPKTLDLYSKKLHRVIVVRASPLFKRRRCSSVYRANIDCASVVVPKKKSDGWMDGSEQKLV